MFFLIAIISALMLTGCSSIYTVNDFSSKDKFYENFNNSVENKTINITLLNDSSVSINTGVVLVNDTLFSILNSEEEKNTGIAISEIEKIDYLSNDYKSATILLKNSEKLNCKNIKIAHDSINFVLTEIRQSERYIVPINNVKTINYKNRWLRTPTGVLVGALIGFSSGIWFATGLKSKDDSGKASGAGVGGALLGGIIGGIFGYWIGYDYIYQFNP